MGKRKVGKAIIQKANLKGAYLTLFTIYYYFYNITLPPTNLNLAGFFKIYMYFFR